MKQTIIKISVSSLVLLTSFSCFSQLVSLNDLIKKSPFDNTSIAEVEQTLDLIAIYNKEPDNTSLGTLLYTLATTKTPVIVKFYSNYCGPCRTMGPILQKISDNYNDKILIIEVDTTTFRSMGSLFNFRYIPTLIFYKNGKEIERTNSLTEDQLQEKIEALL